MKTRILLALLLFAFTVNAQTPFREMIHTEQAFSRMALEKNTRDAFMAFIADDGLLFRPGAVNGKKWMLEHPAPPSDKRPLLQWQPSLGVMAASGDFGYTTGPWESRPDIKDEKPSAYGHFVTVWKKQRDGSWKFVVDLGISHPESGGPLTIWEPIDKKSKRKVVHIDVAAARKDLLKHDRAYAQASLRQGVVKAFNSYSTPEVRLYREGNLPTDHRQTSVALLAAATTGQVSWTPIDGDVSRSGDLGYTHGTYEITDAARKVTERGSYVRIWRGFGHEWRIVLDVTNAHR